MTEYQVMVIQEPLYNLANKIINCNNEYILLSLLLLYILMDNIKYVVTNSLNYYDKTNQKYKDILSKTKYWRHVNGETGQRSIAVLLDKDKKELLRAEYEALGVYYNTHVWTWAWAVPWLETKNIILSRKILNYGLDLNNKADKLEVYMRTILTSSRSKISDYIQLDMYLAIANYLTKNYNTAILKFYTTDKTPILETSNTLYNVVSDKYDDKFEKITCLFLHNIDAALK